MDDILEVFNIISYRMIIQAWILNEKIINKKYLNLIMSSIQDNKNKYMINLNILFKPFFKDIIVLF